MKNLLLLLLVIVVFIVEAKDRSKSRKYDRQRKEESDDLDDLPDDTPRRQWSYSRRFPERDWSPGKDWFSESDFGRRQYRKDRMKRKYTKLNLDRKMFYYWDSVYSSWTNWSKCDPTTCVSSRFRKCKDNSWYEKVRDFKIETKCPVNFIYERKKCYDIKECEIEKYVKSNVSIKTLPKSCGKRPQYIQTKIFGGRETIKNSWPWHGGLYIVGRRKIYICGATLINPGWAVTAAHCLRTLQSVNDVPLGEVIDTRKYNLYERFQLIFGDHERGEKERSEKVVNISHFIIHPEFRADYTSNLYDVALLKLDTILHRQENIDFACIPENINYTLNNTTQCKAIGWGYVTSQDPFNIFSLEFNWLLDRYNKRRPKQVSSNSFILQEVDIPLVDFKRCQNVYKLFNLQKDIHLCAGSLNKDTCRGDSGGGLFCLDPLTNKWQLYGITNFGSARGCGKSYGVYVRVAALAAWIRDSLKLDII